MVHAGGSGDGFPFSAHGASSHEVVGDAQGIVGVLSADGMVCLPVEIRFVSLSDEGFGLALFQHFVGALGGRRCGRLGRWRRRRGLCVSCHWRNGCDTLVRLAQDVFFRDFQRRRTVAEDLASILVDPLPLRHGARRPDAGEGHQAEFVELHGCSLAAATSRGAGNCGRYNCFFKS